VIKWDFYFDKSDEECEIDRVDVSLSLTYTYPEWNTPVKTSPALVEKWNKYMKSSTKKAMGASQMMVRVSSSRLFWICHPLRLAIRWAMPRMTPPWKKLMS
jgi:predicted secreted Zn-dependent protease